MSKKVMCVKTGQEGEALVRNPFPGLELGSRVMESVSQEGWTAWISHSTMLINEYRLVLGKKKDTEFLLKQCEDFFFGDGGAPPPDFTPGETTKEGDAGPEESSPKADSPEE